MRGVNAYFKRGILLAGLASGLVFAGGPVSEKARLVEALRFVPVEDARRPGILNNLALIYHSAGRYLQAESCYRQAVEALRQCCSEDPALARATGNLAALYVETGQIAKAERLEVAALAARLHAARPNDADVARLLVTAGALERSRGRYAKAEGFQLQGLAIWKKLPRSEVETLQAYSELGLTYIQAGRSRDALKSFEQALRIAERALSPGDPTWIQLVANLGGYYFRAGDYPKAEGFYRRALTIAEQAMGRDHPLVVQMLSDYALVLRKLAPRRAAL